MICITCPSLHKIECIDLICNGYVLVLIEVELTDSYWFYFKLNQCKLNVQNVLDQFELKLIQIRFIQIRYIQFRVKIEWFRVNWIRGRNSSTSICPVDRVSCPDMEIWVFPECEFPWTGFHVLNSFPARNKKRRKFGLNKKFRTN